MTVPAIRIRVVNSGPVRKEGAYVLYWMIATRRRRYNLGLQRAVEMGQALGRPLVVLESLRVDYPYASDRLHTFILQGMADNARAFAVPGVRYLPYVEPVAGAGKGLLETLAREACLVVTDDFPCFFLPRMVEAAGRLLPVRLEAVDSNGLFPLRGTDRAWPTAAAFRRMLQRELPAHLREFPDPDPLEGVRLPPAPVLPQEVAGHATALSPASALLPEVTGLSPALAREVAGHGTSLLPASVLFPQGTALLPDVTGMSPALARERADRLYAPVLPQELLERWPGPSLADLADPGALVATLPIDHGVGPGLARGGSEAGLARLHAFLDEGLARYPDARNEPDLDATSGLSPYLHFGHVAAHEVFAALMGQAQWRIEDLSKRAAGQREGWWNAGTAAEAFLDQVVTWREVGYNAATWLPDFDRYESLPAWAQVTLDLHASDARPYCYRHEDFEQACTHDPLWNAAQNQLRREGRLHNYLRMLWGKKILEWSATPRQALQTMIELNDRYALDGRDPNGYSGIFWCLGRFDRPWPERAVFGKIRCMTSDSTARKHGVREFLRRYA